MPVFNFKISTFIEKNFWLVLIAGIVFGLWNPGDVKFPPFLPKLLLGGMLFFVFLKIDAIEILENIKNYKLMIYISAIYMFAIPVFFYFSMNITANLFHCLKNEDFINLMFNIKELIIFTVGVCFLMKFFIPKKLTLIEEKKRI
jgi:hypothetical protein